MFFSHQNKMSNMVECLRFSRLLQQCVGGVSEIQLLFYSFLWHMGFELGTYPMFGMSQCLPPVCSAACHRTSSHGEPRLLSMCSIHQSPHPSAPHAPYFA